MTTIRFHAAEFSKVWRSVMIATPTDKPRPIMHNTILIETYREGVRLTATDSYILITGWVPTAGNDPDRISYPAEIYESPDESFIVQDIDGRVTGLLKYAEKVAAKTEEIGGDAPELDVTITTDDTSWFLPGMSARVAKFTTRSLGETVMAPVVEAEYPNWRALWPFQEEDTNPTDVIGLGSFGILRFGKLAEIWGGVSLRFAMYGPRRPVLIDLEGGEYEQRIAAIDVRGLGMPVALHRNDQGREVAVPIDMETVEA